MGRERARGVEGERFGREGGGGGGRYKVKMRWVPI